MCGILGQVEFNGTVDRPLFDRMRDTLAHRGPDGAGTWMSEDRRLALGHRRLAFLDLTEAGTQPMLSEDGNLAITLNGEIYNYLELREELMALGHRFRTRTDTEVLLHAYSQWGIQGALERLIGMFAFGLIDLRRQKLLLVRDRFGIKPLYYHHSEARRLVFASELKSIMTSGLVNKVLDHTAFTDYFVYRYIPSPHTIWKDVQKLPPAHLLELDLQTGSVYKQEYWSLSFGDRRTAPQALAAKVGGMMKDSVALHARSDVELGTFLSGGYDSSAIAALLAEQVPELKTFSIGFNGWDNSEHQYADIVARHLGVDHIPLLVGADSLDLLHLMPTVYDEPIADISIIPTYLVSRSAASKVKAVMSGEGADELFGGYTWQKEYFGKWHPKGIMARVGTLFADRNATAVDEYARYMSMGHFDRDELNRMAGPTIKDGVRHDPYWFYRCHCRPDLSPLRMIQNLDIKCFMGELVLAKVDRASMANSLEVRVPFLDHRLFEAVMAHDERDCFKPDINKLLLYLNIRDRLPKEILNRPKQGFVGPDSYYMDTGRYSSLLSSSFMAELGLVDQDYITRLLAHKDHWRLWKLAVMELWCRQWLT